jgi:2-C-methyl-D-erythritol 4-phosphate cytidylyltransferase
MGSFLKQAIIVAGGAGTRFGNETPKQFLELEGVSVIEHTILRFLVTFPDIRLITVIPAEQQHLWEEVVSEQTRRKCLLTSGGPTRLDSVKNGLQHILYEGIVAIHDAVRPLVDSATLKRCFETAMHYGNAIPATALTDSIRQIDGNNSQAVNRKHYVAVQTPQCFKVSQEYLAAYAQAEGAHFTDDASVWEHANISVHLCEGSATNLKITHPVDLAMAKSLLSDEC